MKILLVILTSFATLTIAPGFASAAEFSSGKTVSEASGQSTMPEKTPVRLSFTTDLVEDFPIDVTAVTTEERIIITMGPLEEGRYCSIDAHITRQDDGSISLMVDFGEETHYHLVDGTRQTRSVGFDYLTIPLNRGEETVLFSSGEKSFVVAFHD